MEKQILDGQIDLDGEKGKWKDIEGTLNEISDTGSIRRKGTKKPMKGFVDPWGFRSIVMSFDGENHYARVARLVAWSFGLIESRDAKADITHIDGNNLNDSLSNLKVQTHKEVCEKRILGPNATRPVDAYLVGSETVFKSYKSEHDAAEDLDVPVSAISDIVNRKDGHFSIKGYTFSPSGRKF